VQKFSKEVKARILENKEGGASILGTLKELDFKKNSVVAFKKLKELLLKENLTRFEIYESEVLDKIYISI